VLAVFCTWSGLAPAAWIHDCQAAIIRAVELASPSSHDFLCVFLTIRAWGKQITSKCSDPILAATVITMLHSISMTIVIEENALTFVTSIRGLLVNEFATLQYLETTWFNRLKMWAFCYRGTFDRTNNLNESHFHALKASYLMRRVQWRIDALAVKLMTEVMRDFIVADFINTPDAADCDYTGANIAAIPIPNEERDVQLHSISVLMTRIRKTAAVSGSHLRILYQQLLDVLKSIE
jgi:hypothetical protein